MGTTKDAVQAQSGIELCYVLAVEGYQHLLSDMTDLTAVTTAWAASDWDSALTGLQVSGDLSQSLKPWSNEPKIPSMTFRIVGDNEGDTFATDVFKSKPNIRTGLTVGFDTNTSNGGSFNLTVQDEANFDADSIVYIGTEAFQVGTPAANTLPVIANGSGHFAPFGGDTGIGALIGPHNIPQGSQTDRPISTGSIQVTDAPALWIGKRVGLWVHRVVNGVLDVKAEAELIFAGHITEISEGELTTDIACQSIIQKIFNSEVLDDQWVGTIKEGFTFKATDRIAASIHTHTPANVTTIAGAFFPGAVTLSIEEFCSQFADHLDADANLGAGTTLDLLWSCGLADTQMGPRFQITATTVSGSLNHRITLFTINDALMQWLGFTTQYIDSVGASVGGQHDASTQTSVLLSDQEPFRYSGIGLARNARGLKMILEGSAGTFFDHTENLPPSFRSSVEPGDVWSLFILAGKIPFFGRLVDNTTIDSIQMKGYGFLESSYDYEESRSAIRVKSGKGMTVKQIVTLTGSFCDVVSKLFASTDGNGVNHATYDVLPFGAGVPWGLLGDDWQDSLSVLEEAGVENAMTVIIEKPMRLWDLVKSDFAMRMAQIIWKDQGIQVGHLNVPSVVDADWTLTEANKGNSERSRPRETTELLTHTIKLEHNRTIGKEEFADTLVVRSAGGYENYARSGKTKTIKARNTFAGALGSGASAEALGDMLASRFLPVLAKPMKTWTRSVCQQIAMFIAPGDTVNISDDRLRNPLTGKKGISGRAATVVSTSYSLGISSGGQEYHGEVELLYSEEDRMFPIAPSCESSAGASGVATGRDWSLTNFAGYDDAQNSLLVFQDSFSGTGSNDVDGFADGDEVRVTAIDPAGGAPDTFLDTLTTTNVGVVTISSVLYDEAILTNGFGSGGRAAYDETKQYYINFAEHDEVVTGQQDRAFQSDDKTGTILGVIEPNLQNDRIGFDGSPVVDLTLLPARYSAEQYSDGVPMSASFIRDQVRNVNNLVARRTAIHVPMMLSNGAYAVGAISTDYAEIYTVPISVGRGGFPGSLARTLKIAAQFCSSDGTAASLIVTSSGAPPTIESTGAVWGGPKQQITFSTTDTANWPIAAAQSLTIVRDTADQSLTWITVEGNDFVEFVGLPEFWMEVMA